MPLILRYKFNCCKNILYSSIYGSDVTNRYGITCASDSIHGDVAYFNESDAHTISSIEGSSPRTISCWVKRLDRGVGIIHNNGSQEGRYSTYFGMGDKELNVNYGTGYLTHIGKFPILTWFHVVSTYDETTMKLYINGILCDSKVVNINTSPGEFAIGNDPSIGPEFKFNGYMLDFRVYDDALSSTNVSNIYSDGPNPFSIFMYSNGALIEWNSVNCYHIVTKDENGNIFSKKRAKGTYVNIYNLNDNEIYNFEVYSDSEEYKLIFKMTKKTPKIDENEVNNLIKFVSKDLTKIKNKRVSKISNMLGNNLNTYDTLKGRVKFNKSIKPERMTFVQNYESIPISKPSIILTPFVFGGNSSQNVKIKVDDYSTETVTYNELNNTVSVDSKTYSIGDTFIMGGKTVRVSELN